MINSVIYFYNDNYNNEKEFDVFYEDLNATKLGLIPQEEYSQIIDLGKEIDSNSRNIQELGVLINGKDFEKQTLKYNPDFSKNGRYLFLYFLIKKDYKDNCLQFRIKINNEIYHSNRFTCNMYNKKFSSLITYRHKENLYGTPYTEFNNIFQQIRIPAYYQRRITNAETETSYNPGIIPIEDVSRIERTFKEVYTVIATDLLNKSISCALDSDFVYLNRWRVIVEPYIHEEIEEGGWFSKSELTIQKIDERFNGNIDYPYNLIFNYQADTNLTDFTNCFNGNVLYINWGDGTEDKSITHTYSTPGIYQIKIKTENTDTLKLQYKNVISFVLIPDVVDKIDCTGCRLSLQEIYNLFIMINSNNPTDAQITYPTEISSFFSKYIIVSSQQPPVLLDALTIMEAGKLIAKYWFVDYSYNRNWSSAIYSSRYMDPNNYQELYPFQHYMHIVTKNYVFPDEDAVLSLEARKPSGTTPWGLMDWECFMYTRLDSYINGSWQSLQRTPYPTKADAGVPFGLGKLSKGFHKYRVVQQAPPNKIGNVINYDSIKKAEAIIPSINKDDTLLGTTTAIWSWNINKNTDEGIYYGMFFSKTAYNGLGEVIENIEFPSFFKNSTVNYIGVLKENYALKITEAGSYKFTFNNYTIDFSYVEDSFDWLSFRFVYLINDNIYESNQVMWKYGRVIVEKEIIVNNLPVGALISPLIIGESKKGITTISGKIDVLKYSSLLISKL